MSDWWLTRDAPGADAGEHLVPESSSILDRYDTEDRLEAIQRSISKTQLMFRGFSAVVIACIALAILHTELWMLFGLWPSYVAYDNGVKLKKQRREAKILGQVLEGIPRPE